MLCHKNRYQQTFESKYVVRNMELDIFINVSRPMGRVKWYLNSLFRKLLNQLVRVHVNIISEILFHTMPVTSIHD